MTREEFKEQLYQIRENRRIINSIRTSLRSLPEDYLSTIFSGAIDYSKERVQSTSDPDGKMINTLVKIDRDTQVLLNKLQKLEEENEYYESLILNAEGIGAEILRLFFIEGYGMNRVASQMHYSVRTCWKYWRLKITDIYEEVKDDG